MMVPSISVCQMVDMWIKKAVHWLRLPCGDLCSDYVYFHSTAKIKECQHKQEQMCAEGCKGGHI